MSCLKFALCIALIVCCLMPIGTVFAQGGKALSSDNSDQKPLWEAGISGLAFSFPHYVGSDEHYTFALPVPYFIYRGEIFKSNRDGMRGLFFKGGRFETDISLGGNLPVSSENNDAREGMPELDALVEIGPAIRYYFHRRKELDHLYLQAALRGAVSIGFNGGLDFDVDYRGYRSTLDLRFKNKSLFQDSAVSIYFSAGLSYADDILNGYFYDVQPQFATPVRDPYNAGAGYAGFHLSSSIYKELSEQWAIGGYVRWQNINGATFEDSSLVRTNDNFYVSVLLVWKFAKSEEMVSVAN